jgi:large subunit ribosomal protein L24
MALHIKKGDQVMVVSGREKGKQGKVVRIQAATPYKPGRIFIEKLAMVKRHKKPDQGNRAGGIIEKEASIAISSVMLIDPKSEKPTRVRVKTVDGKKVRVAVKSGEVI